MDRLSREWSLWIECDRSMYSPYTAYDLARSIFYNPVTRTPTNSHTPVQAIFFLSVTGSMYQA